MPQFGDSVSIPKHLAQIVFNAKNVKKENIQITGRKYFPFFFQTQLLEQENPHHKKKIILLFSMKKGVSNGPIFFEKNPSVPEKYKNPFELQSL